MQNIDPADWTYRTIYYCGHSTETAQEMAAATVESLQVLTSGSRHPEAKSLLIQSPDLITGKCDHCGAWHCWGSVFSNAAGLLIAVGHQCAANTVGLPDKATLIRERAASRASSARQRNRNIRAGLHFLVGLIRGHADQRIAVMAWLRTADTFSADFRRSLFEYGRWSDRQVEVVLTGAAKRVEWAARKLARDAEEAAKPPALPAPAGRWSGTLKLVHIKEVLSEFGTAYKGLWVHADGWKAWFSVPSALPHDAGQTVHLTVTLEPKPDDHAFAFGTRPRLTKPVTTLVPV